MVGHNDDLCDAAREMACSWVPDNDTRSWLIPIIPPAISRNQNIHLSPFAATIWARLLTIAVNLSELQNRMRLPQRFERLPNEEPHEEGASMPNYPVKPGVDVKDITKDAFVNSPYPVPTNTEYGYNGGTYNSAGYTVSHRRTLVDFLEDQEKRRYGTRFFGNFYDTFVGGWRAGLLRAFLLSLIALIVNISVYAWLYRTYERSSGTATIQRGPCKTIRAKNTGVHAALNILSTMILGASTYAMQGMTAPTRVEVDAAHAKGKWMEIGTQSVRNLFYLRRRNTWVWILLAITSLPFHLFFNAVFFTTTHANQYAVAVVAESILSNPTFEANSQNSSPDLFDQRVIANEHCEGKSCDFDVRDEAWVAGLVQSVTNNPNLASFVRMEPHECIQNYSLGFMQGYGDVVVVSNNPDAATPVLYTRFPQRFLTADKEESNQDPYNWICRDIIASPKPGKDDRCSVDMAMERFDSGKNWTVRSNPVSYCLARAVPDTCELQFNQWLMLGVVIFGGAKTIVISYILLARRPGRFLRTVGDAIASFLEQEDPTTKDLSLVSSMQIRKSGFQEPYAPQVFTGDRPRWLSSANTTEFFSTVGVFAFYIVVLSIALFFAIDGAHGFAFSNGLGVPNIQSLASFKADDVSSTGIVPTLLLANVPQLGFSLLYVAYANIWSKLLVAHEFDRMTQSKKGLRVSERRRGMQRASHFFTLPVRYALPLMSCSAALHWLCSQSFFMVRIDGVNSRGETDPEDRLVRLGYSVTGIVSLVGVAVVMMVTTVCIGSLRRLGTGLGETSMSVVISAACHPGRYENEPWLQEVQWGDVTERPEVVDDTAQHVRHISFTARLARRPIVGQAYL
ncbi:hypothetical protein BDU57DRAFT_583233 [Ampelomyces quisqualis]|uniref:DUF6536 domain-containing protein n=1 Tax=Ampelomyces quisqualis TaxID=50730 RepID=A0A6A5QE31_AMPQU|nr:hypothetical protein BDU57DRAFT_583233 [Ampelomyces quisqualis]